MRLNEYQEKAAKTAMYPKEAGIAYVTMGLAGEAGEISNKVKKIYRDNGGVLTVATQEQLAKEVGDVLWYVAMMAKEFGYTLEEVAQMNIDKLESRYNRGAIQGEGDER